MEICAIRIMEDRSRLGVMYLEGVLIKLITLSISRTRPSDMETYRALPCIGLAPSSRAPRLHSPSPFRTPHAHLSMSFFSHPPSYYVSFLFIYFGFPLNRGCGYAPGVGISCNTCLPSFWSYDSMGTLGYP